MASRKRVLVLGWYGKGNLGDEAFRASFPVLWPACDFTFADRVPPNVNDSYDAVMVGGGSFMDSAIPGITNVAIPMAFVGIGVGGDMNGEMRLALARAKVAVLRDQASLANLPFEDFRNKALVAADLVYARDAWPKWTGEADKLVTILLSEHFAPRGPGCPEWVAASWRWFCRELAQVCDKLVVGGYRVEFSPMSAEPSWDDRRASAHVVSSMERAHKGTIIQHVDEGLLFERIARSSLVISQRLHGVIFSQAIGAPCLAIAGHDKVRGFCRDAEVPHIDYFAMSAATIESTAVILMSPRAERQPNTYKLEAREKWRVASAVVARELSL